MFQILTVTLSNFRSYRNQTFTMPTEPGLYYLTGSNQVEPGLGSNGSGKSTLLDAVYWCLYGRTLRGLRAADVITWGESTCTVTVRLVVAERTYEITRSQAPNKLTVNGQPMEQDVVSKHLGINADAFAHAVVLPQFGRSFFELSPTDKLSLFSGIMNLDFWLEKSELASTTAAEFATEINAINAEITASNTLIASYADEIKQLQTKYDQAEQEHRDKLKDMRKKADELQAELTKLNNSSNSYNHDVQQLTKQRDKKLTELASIEEAGDQHTLRRDKLAAMCATLRIKANSTESMLSELTGIKGTCPTCRQRVSLQHLRDEKQRLEAQWAGDRQLLEQASDDWTAACKFVTKAQKDIKQLVETVNDINVESARLCTKLGGIKEQHYLISKQLDELEKTRTQKYVNPYTELLEKKQAKKGKAIDVLVEQKRELKLAQADHAAISYWVTGFKRVRLFIIEETLRALEVEVNNSLASLGLVNWQVQFDVERENKAGGLTKGFVVFVTCPWNKEPVKFEAWSGGEMQRLLLAGDFGLANLIMTQAGLANKIELIDEPSDHLSDEGLIDLAETLHERALNDSKVIFLIDHRNVDFGSFANVYRVTKTEKGSCLS